MGWWCRVERDRVVVVAHLNELHNGPPAAKNANELATKPDIDGFLVGGASLKPEFINIVNSADPSAKTAGPVNVGINGFGRIGRLVRPCGVFVGWLRDINHDTAHGALT